MKFHQAAAAIALSLLSLPASAQETLGPWTIGATPISATASGLGASAGWLNVVNTPVTLTEAFSGFSMIDDGYSNLLVGDTIDLEFAPGALGNGAGPDFVILDAQYDAPLYRVSTSHDGFAQSILLDEMAFVDSGLSRPYFYELNTGPFLADVTGATVDLSDLGVPPGTTVITVRISAEAIGCDPLGVGALIEPLGTPFCQAAVNTTGQPAEISALGTPTLVVNDVSLHCDQLPANSTAVFITSLTQGFVANPAGSQGNLCLAGAIGRYVGPSQIQNSGSTGNVTLLIDLTQLPQPLGAVAGSAGQVWSFQTWYRDTTGGMPTSNFSNGLAITLL